MVYENGIQQWVNFVWPFSSLVKKSTISDSLNFLERYRENLTKSDISDSLDKAKYLSFPTSFID
jgi:hypothetical protein